MLTGSARFLKVENVGQCSIRYSSPYGICGTVQDSSHTVHNVSAGYVSDPKPIGTKPTVSCRTFRGTPSRETFQIPRPPPDIENVFDSDIANMVWLYRSPTPVGREVGLILAQIVSTLPWRQLQEVEEQRVLNDLLKEQAFSSSYDFAPPQPLPPSSVGRLDRRHT